MHRSSHKLLTTLLALLLVLVATEAVAGGTSVRNAYGSAFSSCTPPLPGRISYLYRAPLPTSGTNSSQTPLAPRVRIGYARLSQ